MYFSVPHHWQGSDAVIQVLAFKKEADYNAFKKALEKEIDTEGIESYDENGLGAWVKLRAVKARVGWDPVVRSARKNTGGQLLWEDQSSFATPEEAIEAAKDWFLKNKQAFECLT